MSEIEPYHDPVVTFRHYEATLAERLKKAEATLVEGMNLFAGGYPVVNEALADAGRPDLAITQPADMMPVEHPQDIVECNNFIPGFKFSTVKYDTQERDCQHAPVAEKVPATTEEILALRTLPRITSFDELQALRHGEQHPAFFSLTSHGKRAAFTRMINLFPGFTANFAAEFSAAKALEYRHAHYEAELFVAYQLMSRLVDITDYDVTKEDTGEVDDWYLCR